MACFACHGARSAQAPVALAVVLCVLAGCKSPPPAGGRAAPGAAPARSERWLATTLLQQRVAAELARQCGAGIAYRDGYHAGGAPPPGEGVCTDVLLRAYLAANIDLQALLARDVARARGAYAIGRPDRDIDHRRCRNLLVFFGHHAQRLPAGSSVLQTGDVVFWSTRRNGRADHVGVIVRRAEPAEVRVVHHWPGRPVAEEDALGRWYEVGRFRWPALNED